jgi:CRISPR-associated protein (TIGR02710 family)
MQGGASVLLICTVGGSPEPIVATIKHWRPARIRFVHSPQTKAEIETTIVPKATAEGLQLDPGRYDLFELPDAEDFRACVDRLRALTADVEQWDNRGGDFQVVVDFTGGTKCMSAALALQARRWPCRFSYVGGSSRNKAGVGVVVPGTEKVVHSVNPWDALGYQAIEDFVVLFDQGACAAAARVVEGAKKRLTREDRKRELNVLEQLAKAFDAWDRFEHQAAAECLKVVEKGANDLRAALGVQGGNHVLDEIPHLARHLDQLLASQRPGRCHVVDLLANALRRRTEGRFDDAVARLYRAIEAVAQVRLAEAHGIESTERVPLERVPEDLRNRLEARAEDGHVRLGLQDAYALLGALGDSLAQQFRQAGLHRRESPLSVRNRSVLAHGFERVSEKASDAMWRIALDLAQVREDELPRFPRLAENV